MESISGVNRIQRDKRIITEEMESITGVNRIQRDNTRRNRKEETLDIQQWRMREIRKKGKNVEKGKREKIHLPFQIWNQCLLS